MQTTQHIYTLTAVVMLLLVVVWCRERDVLIRLKIIERECFLNGYVFPSSSLSFLVRHEKRFLFFLQTCRRIFAKGNKNCSEIPCQQL